MSNHANEPYSTSVGASFSLVPHANVPSFMCTSPSRTTSQSNHNKLIKINTYPSYLLLERLSCNFSPTHTIKTNKISDKMYTYRVLEQFHYLVHTVGFINWIKTVSITKNMNLKKSSQKQWPTHNIQYDRNNSMYIILQYQTQSKLFNCSTMLL